MCGATFVIASAAKQSRQQARLDCFVASLLAMTVQPINKSGHNLWKTDEYLCAGSCMPVVEASGLNLLKSAVYPGVQLRE
jgi:hypothetical protein